MGMKTNILILSSLVCLCGLPPARASDCADCDINPTDKEPTVLTTASYVPYEEPGWLDYEFEEINPQELYRQNMMDAAATRARVEELLAPQKPAENLWFTNMPPMPIDDSITIETSETYVFYDGCPFESETECEIWRRKPIVREAVAPRSKTIRAYNMNPLINALDCNIDLSANETVAAPLLERYKMLMKSAQACCTDGMAYALRKAGASDGLIYKFMADDANFYGLGARCLMMTDYDLDTKYPKTATAIVAADVRNGCLCRNRNWFESMLMPFTQAYNAVPEFKDALFN